MTTRDRNMILTVVAVVLLGAFWFFLLSPQRKNVTAAQAALASAQTDLQSAQQKLSAGKAAADAFRRDRTTIVKLGRVIPETDDIPTLLTQLSAIAKKYSVTFKGFQVSASGGSSSTGTPASTTPTSGGDGSTNAVAPLYPPGSVQVAGGVGRTPIELDLIGEYQSLQNYLRAVERFAIISQKHSSTNGRLIVVDAFSYALGGEFQDNIDNDERLHPSIQATLDASVYFAPPVSVPSAASAAAATAGTPATSTTTTGSATIGGLR